MVKKISEEEKKSLIERTIAVLPNNPSAAGYSADVIKRAMYQVIAGIDEADTEINIADLINEIVDSVQSEIEATKTEVLANVESGDSKLNADILTLANDLGLNVDYIDKKIDTLTETNASEHAQINKDMAQIGTGKIIFTQDGITKATIVLRSTDDQFVNFNTYGADLNEFLKKSEMYTKDEITSMISNLEQIANGKTNSFAVSIENNSKFNSQEDEILLGNESQVLFTTLEGAEVNGTEIREIGDVVLVKETNVPDRWLGKVNGNIYAYKLETQKIDLKDYYTKTEIEQYVADYVATNSKIKRVMFNGVEQTISDEGSVDIVLNTKPVSKKGIDTTPTENSENLITSGGVYSQIGNLINLGTTDKSSLVNAINEVKNSSGGFKLYRYNFPNTTKWSSLYYKFNQNWNKIAYIEVSFWNSSITFNRTTINSDSTTFDTIQRSSQYLLNGKFYPCSYGNKYLTFKSQGSVDTTSFDVILNIGANDSTSPSVSITRQYNSSSSYVIEQYNSYGNSSNTLIGGSGIWGVNGLTIYSYEKIT